MQHVLPVQIVVAPTLALAFVALLVLVMMTWIVSKPQLRQTLRLNQD